MKSKNNQKKGKRSVKIDNKKEIVKDKDSKNKDVKLKGHKKNKRKDKKGKDNKNKDQSIKDIDERKYELYKGYIGVLCLVVLVILFFISLEDLGITGFSTGNGECNNNLVCESGESYPGCRDCLNKQGDVIEPGEYFVLNKDKICEVVLKYEKTDIDSAGDVIVHIVDKDGEEIRNFPKKADKDDETMFGYRVDLDYRLYKDPNMEQDYKLRVNSGSEQLFIEDSERECPPYNGNGVCEEGEGYLEYGYFEEDCMKKQGDHIYLGDEERSRFFEVNSNKDCSGIFKFESYDGSEFVIEEYSGVDILRRSEVYYDRMDKNDKGFSVTFKHGPKVELKLRYDEGQDKLYLEDIERSCDVDCSKLYQEECIDQNSYSTCVQDSRGYNVYEVPIESCGSKKVCDDEFIENPDFPCIEECSNECSLESTRCYNESHVMYCGNYNLSDWCYEWSYEENLTVCDEWYVCEDGKCELECNDECDEENETVCTNDTKKGSCGYFDEDPCLDINITECSEDKTCKYNSSLCLCNERWNCTGWSECVDDVKTRTCVDENNCQTNHSDESEYIEEMACKECQSFTYSEWGPCTEESIKTRIKSYIGCDKEDEYVTKECTYIPGPVSPVTYGSDIQGSGSEEVLETQDSEGVKTGQEETREVSQESQRIAQDSEDIEKIRYEMPASQAQQQSVQRSILSRYTILMIFFAIVLIAIGGGAVYYNISKSKKKLDNDKVSGKIDEGAVFQLKDYSKRMMQQGYNKEQIAQKLRSEGWNNKIIDEIFK